MKKLFVVSDVHSFYTQLIKVLNEKGFDKNNPEHWFVSCGDLLDRGPESQQCLKFVNSLERKILIRGNHEDLMEDAINRGVLVCFNGELHSACEVTKRNSMALNAFSTPNFGPIGIVDNNRVIFYRKNPEW